MYSRVHSSTLDLVDPSVFVDTRIGVQSLPIERLVDLPRVKGRVEKTGARSSEDTPLPFDENFTRLEVRDSWITRTRTGRENSTGRDAMPVHKLFTL